MAVNLRRLQRVGDPLQLQRHGRSRRRSHSRPRRTFSAPRVPSLSRLRTTGLRRVGKGGRPRRRDGRSPSRRPGGPAPKRWQRPTTPPAGHDAGSPGESTTSTGGDRWPAGDPPATGRLEPFGQAAGSRTTLTANAAGAGFSGGIEGGRSTPRQSANVLHRVGWLTTLNGRQPALGDGAETASRGTVRNSVHRTVAGKLPGLLADRLKDGEDATPGAPLPRPGFHPTRTPRRPAIVDLRRS